MKRKKTYTTLRAEAYAKAEKIRQEVILIMDYIPGKQFEEIVTRCPIIRDYMEGVFTESDIARELVDTIELFSKTESVKIKTIDFTEGQRMLKKTGYSLLERVEKRKRELLEQGI